MNLRHFKGRVRVRRCSWRSDHRRRVKIRFRSKGSRKGAAVCDEEEEEVCGSKRNRCKGKAIHRIGKNLPDGFEGGGGKMYQT